MSVALKNMGEVVRKYSFHKIIKDVLMGNSHFWPQLTYNTLISQLRVPTLHALTKLPDFP